MHLKRLELQGFKSFARRTVFELDNGLTAIVGPNGVGKSNVADAVRWVLGEQSYRSLRARSGEDLIFAGSGARGRVGMAEAILTFDNSAGWLPIDFSEVSIGRRLYRSGESEYLINGSPVRRRDIVELLARGGLSNNAHIVIGQGLTDAALSMRPEERRRLLEEAAGIAIYQEKRDSALKKLEATEENLQRVNDLVVEITPHLESLHHQAERAQEYRATSQELEEHLTTWYGYRWQSLKNDLGVAERKAKDKEETLVELRERLSRSIQEREERQAKMERLRQDLNSWREEARALRQEETGLLRELAVSQERLRLLARRREELQEELKGLQEKVAKGEEEIKAAQEALKGLEEERERLEARLGGRSEAQKGGPPAIVASAQEAAFRAAAGRAELRSRLAQLAEREREAKGEREEQLRALRALEIKAAESRGAQANLRGQREALKERLTSLTEEGERRKAALEASLLRRSVLQARLAREGKPLEVRSLPPTLTRGKGVLGTLAELMEIAPPARKAIQAALGPLLDGLVVEGWEQAKEIIEGGIWPMALLPLDNLRYSEAIPPQGPAVLGLASQQVNCSQRLQGLLQALLGRTIVVEDLETAQRLYREDREGFQFVTLQGELLTPQGALLFPGEISKTDMEEALREEERGYRSLLTEMESLEEERSQVEGNLREKEGRLSEEGQRLERLTQEVEWRQAISKQVEEELATLARSLSELNEQAREAAAQEEKALSQLAALQERLRFQEEEATQLRTSLALLEERTKRTLTSLQSHRNELRGLRDQMGAKEAREEELSLEIDSLSKGVEVLEVKRGDLAARLTALGALMEPAEGELDSLEGKRSDLERDAAEVREALHRGEMEHSQALSEVERCQDKLQALGSQIEADLEAVSVATPFPKQLRLDLDARLASLPAIAEIPRGFDRKIRHLRYRLRRIGPVNLEAPTEYEKVRARHDFLTTQAQDLREAQDSLRRAIAELDRLMEERFKTTFEAIAQEFRGYFSRLFSGGKARLRLTDPQDLAQTGVEIIVQPPGKRSQDISLLSGGERALTGVALIFAILKACSIPFCLLDEVDAMLDEINIGRFRDSLVELAQRTQMVIVTHNRVTLEAVDAIYGLSLGEDGTSQVVSLRLEEVET